MGGVHPQVSMNKDQAIVLKRALAGAVSAVIANAIVYPIDVMATNSQTSTSQPIKYYAGITSSLTQTFLSNYTYFLFYSALYKLNKSRTVAMNLLMGAFAGALSRWITTPISVLATTQQTHGKSTTFAKIIKERGVLGLWSGFNASLVLTINPAITYGIYESLRPQRSLSALHAFLLAAFTKSLATFISTIPK